MKKNGRRRKGIGLRKKAAFCLNFKRRHLGKTTDHSLWKSVTFFNVDSLVNGMVNPILNFSQTKKYILSIE